MRLDSSNPILSETYWDRAAGQERPRDLMTAKGAVEKTGLLLAVLLVTVGVMWGQFWNHGAPVPSQFMLWMVGGAIAGLLAGLVGMFAPRIAMILGLIYAVGEGLLIGGLTMIIEAQPKMHGISLIAACLTTATLLGMLLLYRAGIIKATDGFMRGVMIATAGLMLGVGLLFVLNLFGIGGGIVATLYGNGPIGIGFSLLCIGLAALNLVVDFGVIERSERAGAPKHMEWVAAFALLTTLVWLYIELLRLLSKLRR